MHTITVSILGDVSVAESVEVNDGEALPLFIRLKAVLQSEGTSKPGRRRGRPQRSEGTEGNVTSSVPSEEAQPAS